MNTVQLTGRLTRDPVLTQTPTGSVCRLRLAVDNMGPKNAAGFIDVSTFGPPAAAAAKVLTKGWLVAVSGRLNQSEWTTAEGLKRSAISVTGTVEFLAAPRNQEPSDHDPDADIPF